MTDLANKRLRSEVSPDAMDKGEINATTIKNIMEEFFEQYGLSTLKKDIDEIKGLKDELTALKESLEFSQKSWEESISTVTKTKEDVSKMEERILTLEKELKEEREDRAKDKIKSDTRDMEKNLILLGVKERENEEDEEETEEDCYKVTYETLEKIVNEGEVEIDVCFRLGKKITSKKDPKRKEKKSSRPILVKFVKKRHRDLIWFGRKKLKGSSIIVKEHLPQDTEDNIKTLLPIMKHARFKEHKAYMVRDQLFIDDRKYSVDDIKHLPVHLHPDAIATKITDKEVFFYGKNAPLSNFYTEGGTFSCEGKKFVCMEQYYAYERANFFKDQEAKEKIMASQHPFVHKKTKVKGFKFQLWNSVSKEVMRNGLKLKFSQNVALRQYLKKTGRRTLVEANPYDNHWGVGLSMNDEKINDRKNWGENWLGKLLMETREEIN